jgi:hypothetical protein
MSTLKDHWLSEFVTIKPNQNPIISVALTKTIKSLITDFDEIYEAELINSQVTDNILTFVEATKLYGKHSKGQMRAHGTLAMALSGNCVSERNLMKTSGLNKRTVQAGNKLRTAFNAVAETAKDAAAFKDDSSVYRLVNVNDIEVNNNNDGDNDGDIDDNNNNNNNGEINHNLDSDDDTDSDNDDDIPAEEIHVPVVSKQRRKRGQGEKLKDVNIFNKLFSVKKGQIRSDMIQGGEVVDFCHDNFMGGSLIPLEVKCL